VAFYDAASDLPGPGRGQHAIRCLRQVPVSHAGGALLLAALRADCFLQVWDLSVRSRPTSVLSVTLPAGTYTRPLFSST